MKEQYDYTVREIEIQQYQPGFLFDVVSKTGNSVLSAMLKDLHLTANQWPVLNQIYQHEGTTQRELAEYCMKDPSAVMKSIDILEKNGLVKRHADEHDRRVFRLFLTEKGREVRHAAYALTRECHKMMCEGLSQEDMEKLYDISMKIYNNLKRSEKIYKKSH